MNRDRDPVGVDAVMHPPVALTQIPSLCEAALRPSVAHLEKQRSTSEKQTERETGCFILLQAARHLRATRLAC